MITRLSLRNFKSIESQDYDFTSFDLFVGWNNSGKSTILQALAIWQFCVDEFRRSDRKGKTGKLVTLPNFTALPVPAFNLLWRNKKDRKYPEIETTGGKKKQQQFILIGIDVTWRDSSNQERSFGVELRYDSSQTIYAIPRGGWNVFRDLNDAKVLPVIAYVPPFSGLEPQEKWCDDAAMRQQVGKAQPGSVLRNLLQRVFTSVQSDAPDDKNKATEHWDEISSMIKGWFGVDLQRPNYSGDRDVYINCEYKQGGEYFDIISGGSGFHQTLTLLAFLYGFHPTTILLDEPDAHMHSGLQREILDYFKTKSKERGIQFIVATHADEFIKGVDSNQVVSLLKGRPERIPTTGAVVEAMRSLKNSEIAKLREAKVLVYVEGEDDERILRAWATKVGAETWMRKIVFHYMHGGSKKSMRDYAESHFKTVQVVLPNVDKVMLFDWDSEETSFHPKPDNQVLFEWKRKNIDNYLLVPEAWERAVSSVSASLPVGELSVASCQQIIRDAFEAQNLFLPKGSSWRNVSANIFKEINGKTVLFEADDSIFNQLMKSVPEMKPNCVSRSSIAGAMLESELHEDILDLFEKIKSAVDRTENAMSPTT